MDRLLEATARAERDHFWFRGLRRFVAPLLGVVAEGRTLEILDCGCGTGNNLPLLRTRGRATGIDLTWKGLLVAHQRGERSIAQADASRLPFSDGRFDLVTSFDVIYALPDDVEPLAIAEMFRVLRPGGSLILNAAAIDALRGDHSILANEVRRYSRADLRHRLERAGFDIVRATYTYLTILPLVAAVRMAQRSRSAGHAESQDEISLPPRPINALLSGLLAAEAAALRVVNMPIGSSLLFLARKPARPAA